MYVSYPHRRDSFDDILCSKSNMLHTCTAIVVAVLLNLGFAFAFGGFVDGHLDTLRVISHYNRPQRTILCPAITSVHKLIFIQKLRKHKITSVQLLVIDRPKAMELENTLIPVGNLDHPVVVLVSDDMVNEFEVRGWSIVIITQVIGEPFE